MVRGAEPPGPCILVCALLPLSSNILMAQIIPALSKDGVKMKRKNQWLHNLTLWSLFAPLTWYRSWQKIVLLKFNKSG